MKKNRLLAVILAGAICLGMGNTVCAEEFQNEREAVEAFGSSNGQSGLAEETFTDGISDQTEVSSAQGLENQEMFSSGSEAEEGTEGLVYEIVWNKNHVPLRRMLLTWILR